MTPPGSSITLTSVEYEEEASSNKVEQLGRPGALGGAQDG